MSSQPRFVLRFHRLLGLLWSGFNLLGVYAVTLCSCEWHSCPGAVVCAGQTVLVYMCKRDMQSLCLTLPQVRPQKGAKCCFIKCNHSEKDTDWKLLSSTEQDLRTDLQPKRIERRERQAGNCLMQLRGLEAPESAIVGWRGWEASGYQSGSDSPMPRGPEPGGQVPGGVRGWVTGSEGESMPPVFCAFGPVKVKIQFSLKGDRTLAWECGSRFPRTPYPTVVSVS